jgi:hypothetical protein
MRVLKWRVPLDTQPHAIGAGQVVLVGQQPGGGSEVQVWTLEASDSGPTREVQVFGTGHQIPDDMQPIGSCLSADGWYVWHVFEWVRF